MRTIKRVLLVSEKFITFLPMLNNDLLLAHTLYSNKGMYALLLGSGISRPSGIPTGWDIVLDLIQKIATLKGTSCVPDPAKWFEEQFGESPDYSNLLAKLSNSAAERLNLLRPYFEATEEERAQGFKQLTKAHLKIAELVKEGYIKVIVTTNFDRLLENALHTVGVQPTVISNAALIDHVMPLIHSSATVIKINGDYLDSSFLNLKSELSAYDPAMASLVSRVFEEFGLLTCGWSGKWDIALLQLLKGSNKFRFGYFSTYVGTPGTELEELALQRRGKLIKIDSADSFFFEVAENVEALCRNEVHPLTKELAVSRLKKYISNETLTIQFADLLEAESRTVYRRINEEADTSRPTHELLKQNIEFYFGSCDTLVTLIIHAVYWGKEQHYPIWIKEIERLAYPKDGAGSSYSLWSTLRYLPATYLLYAAGLAALARKDFKALGQLLSLQLLTRNKEKRTIIYDCNPGSLAEIPHLRTALGNNKLVPMNELFYGQLQPKCDAILASPQLFDDLFDYFEIVFALYYMHATGQQRFPMGRFRYQRNHGNVLPTLFEAIKQQQERHELVREGLFEKKELIDSYTALFNRVNQMHD